MLAPLSQYRFLGLICPHYKTLSSYNNHVHVFAARFLFTPSSVLLNLIVMSAALSLLFDLWMTSDCLMLVLIVCC